MSLHRVESDVLLTDNDDRLSHEPTRHHGWGEGWWFWFFDSDRQIYGVADVRRYPNQERIAYSFGLWREGRALCFEQSVGIPLAASGQMSLAVTCDTPNSRWTIDYRRGGTSASLEWNAMAPIYDWESLHAYGSRHYEQAGRVNGTYSIGAETFRIEGFGHRTRSWGDGLLGALQQCWSMRCVLSEDLHLQQAIATFGGRDHLFGYLSRDGLIEPLESLDIAISHAYPWGPPLRTEVQLMDAAGRRMVCVVAAETVVSHLVCDDQDQLDEHLVFASLRSEGRSAIGHLEHSFKDPRLVRSHMAARSNAGRIYP
jgi:hypothetical protein